MIKRLKLIIIYICMQWKKKLHRCRRRRQECLNNCQNKISTKLLSHVYPCYMLNDILKRHSKKNGFFFKFNFCSFIYRRTKWKTIVFRDWYVHLLYVNYNKKKYKFAFVLAKLQYDVFQFCVCYFCVRWYFTHKFSIFCSKRQMI